MSALASGGVDVALGPTSCQPSGPLPSPGCICPSPLPPHVPRTPLHATKPPFYGMYPSVCTLVEVFHLYIPACPIYPLRSPVYHPMSITSRSPRPYPAPCIICVQHPIFILATVSVFFIRRALIGMHVKQLCHQPAQLSNTWEGKVAWRLDDAVCMYRRMC